MKLSKKKIKRAHRHTHSLPTNFVGKFSVCRSVSVLRLVYYLRRKLRSASRKDLATSERASERWSASTRATFVSIEPARSSERGLTIKARHADSMIITDNGNGAFASVPRRNAKTRSIKERKRRKERSRADLSTHADPPTTEPRNQCVQRERNERVRVTSIRGISRSRGRAGGSKDARESL